MTDGFSGPELSVVIPTKDRPQLLARAAESVLGQAKDIEVIVVDDGSAPPNAAAYEAFCRGDDRITLLRNETALGAPHGRNRGLSLSRGRYWATLDDDDRWLPGKWQAQRAVLDRHGFPEDLVVVMSVRDANGSPPHVRLDAEVRRPERPGSLSALFHRVPPAAFLNTYVVPTRLMRAVGGYDDRLVWGEHTDVLIRLWKVARFAGSGAPGVLVDRGHEHARVGRDWQRKSDGIRLLLAKHAEEFARERGLRGVYRHVLGVSQLRAGDRWAAARTFARLVAEGPGPRRRGTALAHLAVTTVGGRRLWALVSRASGTPAEALA
jgi:glycosyltransferase involved in cell wall biosynthesis